MLVALKGDKPWLSDKANANSFLLAQLNYIENGHTFGLLGRKL